MTDAFYPLVAPPPPPAPPGSDDPKYPLECKVDFTAEGLQRLLLQFHEKPRIEALLASYSDEVQELELAMWDLTQAWNIDTAIGVFLDDLGDLAGISRNGLADSDYRLRIQAKWLANLSQGRTQDLLGIIQLFLGDIFPITVEEPGNLTSCISLDDVQVIITPEDLNFLLQLAKQAGSRLFLKVPALPRQQHTHVR